MYSDYYITDWLRSWKGPSRWGKNDKFTIVIASNYYIILLASYALMFQTIQLQQMGYTPLFLTRKIETVELLIRLGVNVDIADLVS